MNNSILSRLFFYISLLAVVLLFSFCSSDKKIVKQPPPKPEPEPVKVETNKVETVEAVAVEPEPEPEVVVDIKQRYVEEMNEMEYTDYEYRAASPPKSVVDRWKTSNLSRLKEIINDIPDDHVLVITGHANKTKKKIKKVTITNDELANKRAAAFARILQANGVSASKLKTQGAGIGQPISGSDPTDESNRRVTLKIVKK